jgi:hypothetical protein
MTDDELTDRQLESIELRSRIREFEEFDDRIRADLAAMLGGEVGHPCHYEGTIMLYGRTEARVLCGLPQGHDGPHVPETLRWEDE